MSSAPRLEHIGALACMHADFRLLFHPNIINESLSLPCSIHVHHGDGGGSEDEKESR